MNNVTFYNNLKESVLDDIQAVARAKSSYDEAQSRRNSGRYSPEYIRDHIDPEIRNLRSEFFAARDRAGQAALRLIRKYQDELRASDALDPSQINDDIKLLQCGVTLSERDLRDILARNGENKTMTRLVLQYAADHDVKLGVTYMGGEAAARNLDGVAFTVSTIAKRTNEPQLAQKLYNSLLGDGSDIARMLGASE